VDVADAHRTAHEARCRGTPFAPPDVGWGVSLGSPRSSAAASRERAKIDGYACGAAKRSRTERATERAALVPAWSALQRQKVDGSPTMLSASALSEKSGFPWHSDYLGGMAAVYAACLAVLRPGGLLVTVTKNMRRGGRLVDLAATTRRLAVDAGFAYLQHVVALLAAVRGGQLVARPSF
jgi:hypothetical protein